MNRELDQDQDFRAQFKELTGHAPLSWQVRLYRQFVSSDFPRTIDLPTGLGKTMVMAIWLIARLKNPTTLPTRLIYVVDRRTVVDQATDLATDLAENLRDRRSTALGTSPLVISTLRGQLADNREWSRDLSKPAIIIGTVDLIGSALLFSGYRSGFKYRPHEAGLLGCDSLLLLDEAHLSKPFEKLLRSIERFNRIPKDRGLPIKPLRVIRMSATSSDGDANQNVFRLNTDEKSAGFDLWSEKDVQGSETNPIKTRFEAKKWLTIKTVGDKEINQQLAAAAIELAKSNAINGKRIVIFVRTPDAAREIAERIREHSVGTLDGASPKPKKHRSTPYAEFVEVLTGTMRGLERDDFVKKDVVKRFLDGDVISSSPGNQLPCFLVSTSAGEVGFDLNADHMVCDATTLDSFVQRLGRVNRRGNGNATIVLVRANEPGVKTSFDAACNATLALLTDGMSLSPQAIADWKADLTAEQLQSASTPTPATVELTDILLDAWSMTSITGRMPGRPEVGPWLRGIDDEQAQTSVVWRAELELFRGVDSPEQLLATVFAKHPIRPHETLTVNTRYLIEAFLKKIPKLKERSSDLLETRVAIRLPRGEVICKTLSELVEDPANLFADATLILPATFGGLYVKSGMLDCESIPKDRKPDEQEPPSRDEADLEGYETTDVARSRLRITIKKSGGEWTVHPLVGGEPIPSDVRDKLEPTYKTKTALFNLLKGAGFRVRLVQNFRFDQEDEDAIEALVCLVPERNDHKTDDQSLQDHVAEVEQHASRIASELRLPDPFREALVFAARWHDEGKQAPIWQRFANGPMANGHLKGKTALARSPLSLKGYRHEFGSLLRIEYPDRCDTAGCMLPADETVRDLALHLIATHHGSGRPHFSPAVYDPFTDDERDGIHVESIRRFARLQREFGWWTLAWLENLLRCADQLASAKVDSTDIDLQEGQNE